MDTSVANHHNKFPVSKKAEKKEKQVKPSLFSARFKHGDKVDLNFYEAGYLKHGEIVNIKFTESKILYDVDVIVKFSTEKEHHFHTRIYNIDSVFVVAPQS